MNILHFLSCFCLFLFTFLSDAQLLPSDAHYEGHNASGLVSSYLDAKSRCAQLNASLPTLLDVKHFYKPLVPDPVAVFSNSTSTSVYSFYVSDTVEATPFHPDLRQRLCFIVEKDAGSSSIQIANVKAEWSCVRAVNYLVCRRAVAHTTPGYDTTNHGQERTSGKFCMQQSWFYALNVCLLIILLVLTFFLCAFIFKAHRARMRLSRLIRERHDILNDEWSSTGLPLPINFSNRLHHANNRTINTYISPSRVKPYCGNGGDQISRHESLLLNNANMSATTRHNDSPRPANGVMCSLMDHQSKINDSFLTNAVGQSPTLVKHSNQASGFL